MIKQDTENDKLMITHGQKTNETKWLDKLYFLHF